MTGRRLIALVSVAALLLPVGLAAAAPDGQAGAASSRAKGPRIKDGRYGSGDVYLDVDVKARKVHFYFKLYCQNPFASQYVSSVRAVGGVLKGNRRGATVYVDGDYSGVPVSGEGIHQDAFWTMKGKFTGPTHFEGRVEYEAATFPEPPRPRGRPQCIDAELLHLDLEPAG
jgi:hypothetical protein